MPSSVIAPSDGSVASSSSSAASSSPVNGVTADFGSCTRAQSLGDGDAELHAPVGERLAERLGIGVGDDEFHAFQRGADHVVDGVSARTADTDDGDTRLNLGLLLGETEVDGHFGSLHANEGLSARSGSVSLCFG